MEKIQYIKYAQETSEKVYPIIEDVLSDIVKQEPELTDIVSFFYEKRKSKILLKPVLFRLSYELCGGCNFDNFLPAAAAFEVINISSYQANASFDNKMGTLSDEEKDSQFIASMISREIAEILIERLQCSREIVSVLSKCIYTSNLYIYKAQHYDLNLLSLTNIDRCKQYFLDKRLFLEDYNKRCYYGSGVFSGQVAEAGAFTAGANTEQRASLRQFGEIYGTALHKINDLADFFPGEERIGKLYQDYFCDIRNGRLTFPVYELYTRSKYMTKFERCRI